MVIKNIDFEKYNKMAEKSFYRKLGKVVNVVGLTIESAGPDSKVQMGACGITGGAYLCNGLALFYRLSFRGQQLGAMHVYRIYTASVADHDVISRRIAVGRYNHCSGRRCHNGCPA